MVVVRGGFGVANPRDPQNVANIEAGIAKVLTPEMQNAVKQFHFRGGIDYTRMRPMHKTMMAMMRKIILQTATMPYGTTIR